MPMKEYWFTYKCAPSTETRGRRDTHDGGCGWWSLRGSNKPMDGRHDIQGSPCKQCGRRMRLNAGIVYAFKADTPAKRKRLAEEFANRRNVGWEMPSKSSVNPEEMASKSSVNPEEEVSA